jgi:hypothetical protein
MTSRSDFLATLVSACQRDSRIVGLIDYGSGGQGRADEWSDVDAVVFVRNEDFEIFVKSWNTWAINLGRLIHAYRGRWGDWAIYADTPLPLRVDFDFRRESEIEYVAGWPITPAKFEEMALYDDTNGQLKAILAPRLGEPDVPADLSADICPPRGVILLLRLE